MTPVKGRQWNLEAKYHTFSFVEVLTTSISRGKLLEVAKYSMAGS